MKKYTIFILLASFLLGAMLLTQSSSAQGPQPIPTVIDTPMTFGPLFQAQGGSDGKECGWMSWW